MLGLKRGTVQLEAHRSEWEAEAARIIERLWAVLGSAAADIQHVGSTAVRGICAKPIIDIAAAVYSIDEVQNFCAALEAEKIIFRGSDQPGQILFVMGDFENEIRTHHIHFVEKDSSAWRNYIAFRDYLNANPESAREYNTLKINLAKKYPYDRGAYTRAKGELIARLIEKANKEF